MTWGKASALAAGRMSRSACGCTENSADIESKPAAYNRAGAIKPVLEPAISPVGKPRQWLFGLDLLWRRIDKRR
jgi:hypothetical protein